jgi:hypothetical protein
MKENICFCLKMPAKFFDINNIFDAVNIFFKNNCYATR